jgi:hypothetical protein
MATQTDGKSTSPASPAARALLQMLRESPGVPLAVRVMPAYRQLVSVLDAWVTDVEARLQRQEER